MKLFTFYSLRCIFIEFRLCSYERYHRWQSVFRLSFKTWILALSTFKKHEVIDKKMYICINSKKMWSLKRNMAKTLKRMNATEESRNNNIAFIKAEQNILCRPIYYYYYFVSIYCGFIIASVDDKMTWYEYCFIVEMKKKIQRKT